MYVCYARDWEGWRTLLEETDKEIRQFLFPGYRRLLATFPLTISPVISMCMEWNQDPFFIILKALHGKVWLHSMVPSDVVVHTHCYTVITTGSLWLTSAPALLQKDVASLRVGGEAKLSKLWLIYRVPSAKSQFMLQDAILSPPLGHSWHLSWVPSHTFLALFVSWV